MKTLLTLLLSMLTLPVFGQVEIVSKNASPYTVRGLSSKFQHTAHSIRLINQRSTPLSPTRDGKFIIPVISGLRSLLILPASRRLTLLLLLYLLLPIQG